MDYSDLGKYLTVIKGPGVTDKAFVLPPRPLVPSKVSEYLRAIREQGGNVSVTIEEKGIGAPAAQVVVEKEVAQAVAR
jgi:hypothetical protein